MRRRFGRCLVALVVLPLAGLGLRNTLFAQDQAAAIRSDKVLISHSVYFSLRDNQEPERLKLVEACRRLLAATPRSVFSSVGILGDNAAVLNDRDWDVALTVVFADKAALDTYDASPIHKKFIQENRGNWRKVRVFDAYVDPSYIRRN